jgi:DNA end-binding protein Ku
MARPIWTGAITFGLVSVPVSMYSATHEHEVSFHQFEKGTADRIRYRRVNERSGKEVEYDEIVKGADVGGGDYVMLEQEELDSVAPGRSTIRRRIISALARRIRPRSTGFCAMRWRIPSGRLSALW